eukprot:Clim_evm23s47 gene=Clim_evmTU23s47
MDRPRRSTRSGTVVTTVSPTVDAGTIKKAKISARDLSRSAETKENWKAEIDALKKIVPRKWTMNPVTLKTLTSSFDIMQWVPDRPHHTEKQLQPAEQPEENENGDGNGIPEQTVDVDGDAEAEDDPEEDE